MTDGKKTLKGIVDSKEEKQGTKGNYWTVKLSGETFNVFADREHLFNVGQPVSVTLERKDKYWNIKEARPIEASELPAELPKPEPPRMAGSTNQSIESQVSLKEVGECLRSGYAIPTDVANAYWQFIRSRLHANPPTDIGTAPDFSPPGRDKGTAATPQPHQDAPQPAQGPSEAKGELTPTPADKAVLESRPGVQEKRDELAKFLIKEHGLSIASGTVNRWIGERFEGKTLIQLSEAQIDLAMQKARDELETPSRLKRVVD